MVSVSPLDLLLLLGDKAGGLVHDLDTKSLSALADELPGLGRGVVVDHSGVLAVVHEEELEVLDVGDVEADLPVSSLVLETTVSPVPDLGLGGRAFEPSAHGVIDTMGLSPASLYNRKKEIKKEKICVKYFVCDMDVKKCV